MNQLEKIIQSELSGNLRSAFNRFCLLLQAYSDATIWSYQCDFNLDDDIYWQSNLFVYGGGFAQEMDEPIKDLVKNIIQKYITVDFLFDEISDDTTKEITNQGWFHFNIYPYSKKLDIEISYDIYDTEDRNYESSISELVNESNLQDRMVDQLNDWDKQGAVFTIYYEGDNGESRFDDVCESNVGINKIPEVLANLGWDMINEYESGYYYEEGGKGSMDFNFKEDTIYMNHIEYSTRSVDKTLAEVKL